MKIVTPADGWGPWTPRRWQAEADAALVKHFVQPKPERAIMRAIMGAGKSIVLAQFLARCVPAEAEVTVVTTSSIHLVEQLAGTIRSRLEPNPIMQKRKVGLYYTHGKDVAQPIIVTCVNSTRELATILRDNGRRCALWVCDECVPAGTMISTPNGLREIETLAVGDYILGFNHHLNRVAPARVRRCFTRQTRDPFVRIGHRLCVTPEHPVWSGGQYIPARLLDFVTPMYSIEPAYKGDGHDANVRVVQMSIRMDTAAEENTATAFLQSVLCQSTERSNSMESGAPSEGCYSHETAYQASGCAREASPASILGQQSVSQPRGSAKGSNSTAGKDGIWSREHVSDLLQDRYCGPDPKDRDRSRRPLSPFFENQGEGRKEGFSTDRPWMEDSAVYKLGGLGRPGECCKTDTRSVPVYNIETESSNYFAEGLLVHNCHRSRSATIEEAYSILLPDSVLGMTATPFRSNEDESLHLFDKMIYSYGPREAIADDPSPIVPWRIMPWTGGESTLDEACWKMTQNAEGPGMYNAISIADAEVFVQFLNDHGTRTEVIHSEMPRGEIKKRLQRLKAGELKAIVHVAMLQEGVDLPWLYWLCMRRPVGSRVRFVQEIGRILRSYTDPVTGVVKKFATIHDPHDLSGSLALDYEAVIGGDYLVADEDNTDAAEAARKAHELEQQVLDIMRHLNEVKQGRAPLSMSPLAAYLRELVVAFDICGLMERKIADRSWRLSGLTPKQDKVITEWKWPLNQKVVPPIHQKALLKVADSHSGMNRGTASDLISIIQSLAKNHKWPNFKPIDKSAEEGLGNHEKHRLANPAPVQAVKGDPPLRKGNGKAKEVGTPLLDALPAPVKSESSAFTEAEL